MPTFEIDLNYINAVILIIGQMPPGEFIVFILRYFAWIPITITLLYGIHEVYIYNMKVRFARKQKKMLLAIDIPKDNIQTPKAVENIISQLAGGHASVWWWDVYLEGEFQQSISLEIVSVEGHIQFLIHMNVKFKDLVEAAIFAQYPQARITEVADYTANFPSKFPNDEYDLWGVEFVYVKPQVYPIKVYSHFGDPLTQEYKDPMAAFLEILSRMGKGEHIWFQIILLPISQEWAAEGAKEIDKIMGRQPKSKKTILDQAGDAPLNVLKRTGDVVFGPGEGGATEQKSTEKKMMDLPPGDANKLNYIDQKCSKIGFMVKIRLIYIAKHESFNKAKAAYALVGAIKQFNTEDANSLKPDYKTIGTGGDFFFKFRKNKVVNARRMDLMMGYRKRLLGVGTRPFVMNIEEIASLYHFPIETVKTPLVKKIDVKTAEPPANLPSLSDDIAATLPTQLQSVTSKDTTKSDEELRADPFDYDNDYFERKFAVAKTKTLNDLKPPKPPTPPQPKNVVKESKESGASEVPSLGGDGEVPQATQVPELKSEDSNSNKEFSVFDTNSQDQSKVQNKVEDLDDDMPKQSQPPTNLPM